jgi:DNA-binding MarR family transcriptional regulator
MPTRSEPSADSIPAQAVRLRAALSLLNRRLRANADHGLGVAGLAALQQLHRHGALTPSQLARHEGVRLQSLTRLLAALEDAGLVTRRAHPDDGRQSLLELAAAGRQALKAEAQRREASLAAALRRLSDDERATLAAACTLLERLVDAFGPADGPAA